MMAVQKERDGNAEVTIPPCCGKGKNEILQFIIKDAIIGIGDVQKLRKVYILRLLGHGCSQFTADAAAYRWILAAVSYIRLRVVFFNRM